MKERKKPHQTVEKVATRACNLSLTRGCAWDSGFQDVPAAKKPPVGSYWFLEARSAINNRKPHRNSGLLCTYGDAFKQLVT